jgi:hypothetical protein
MPIYSYFKKTQIVSKLLTALEKGVELIPETKRLLYYRIRLKVSHITEPGDGTRCYSRKNATSTAVREMVLIVANSRRLTPFLRFSRIEKMIVAIAAMLFQQPSERGAAIAV